MSLRWAVPLPPRAIPFKVELAEGLCRALGENGLKAGVVEDGDPEGLKADVLLLTAFVADFPDYVRQLRRSGTGRPRVVLWQLDALPPSGTPTEAMRAGLRAAAWPDRLRLNRATGGMARWEKLVTLIRIREWLCKQVSAPGYRRTSRLMASPVGELGELDWRQVRGVMENWWWLRTGLAEGWLDRVAVSTLQRQRFLAAQSVQAAFVPVGAFPAYGRDLGLERDIDVLFLGRTKHGRRAESLARLERDFRERGIRLHAFPGEAYGEERTRLLNRARIVLNLHTLPWSPAWMRFLMATLCGAVVVSEPTEDQAPFAEGVHYAAAPVAAMPELIAALLADADRRAALVAASSALCSGSLTLVASARALAGLAN